MAKPSHVNRLKLESRNSKLPVMMPSGECLIQCDSYHHKTILQVSLDFEFNREYDLGRQCRYRQFLSAAMIGSSCLVIKGESAGWVPQHLSTWSVLEHFSGTCRVPRYPEVLR